MTGSLDRAELQIIGEEVQREGKLQALAESFEMTTHYKQSTQGIDLLDRWQTEMKQFNIHARSHLVHHLRCINLDDTANRYCTNIVFLLDVHTYKTLIVVLHKQA